MAASNPTSPIFGLSGLALWFAIFALCLSPLLEMSPRDEMDFSIAYALSYPEAPEGSVVDTYHGTTVADPWRSLEDLDSAATRSWVVQQNALTEKYIAKLPGRERFATRLKALLNDERRGAPERENGVYVYRWNPGQAEQDVLRVTDDLAAPGTVLLDPLRVRADGTVSIGDFVLSPDGKQLAYALSDGGSDWKTWRVRNTDRSADDTDRLVGTKFTTVSWTRDGGGFYYSRYPFVERSPALPGEQDERASTDDDPHGGFDDGRQVAVYFHRLGTPQATDRLVYGIKDHPTRDPYATVTRDGRFLILNIEDGYLSNAVYYQRLLPAAALGKAQDAASTGEQGAVVRLLDAWDARYDFLGVAGDTFYFLTTKNAPKGRVIAIDLKRPRPAQWREVVPESARTISAAVLAGGRLVVQSIEDVRAELDIYELTGALASRVTLPGEGTVADLTGDLRDPDAFLVYTDFTTPRRVYRLSVASAKLTATGPEPRAADPGRFVSQQVFVVSRDGTRVPMTIVHRRDIPLTRRSPTVLYGYGGFNVSLLPTWSASRLAWIEAGGVYAQANLRGGGEYGEAWHLAGTRLNKQHVFDDFIAAAEWLIANDMTSPDHLAIWGGSNGGLLVGAALNQRADLFAAAVPAVGVMDMLRYQTASLNARKWASDYGLSEDPAEFRALRAYSPYHNIRSGICYPAVLVQADANDDRVVAWHSYKYAAALQAAQSSVAGCRQPTLIRVEKQSGHGAGASFSKTINEYADQWTFVAAATGLRVGQ